jgi:hypothetical protein
MCFHNTAILFATSLRIMLALEIFGDSKLPRPGRQSPARRSVFRQTTTQASLRDNLKTVAQSTRHILVSALSNPQVRGGVNVEGLSHRLPRRNVRLPTPNRKQQS